MALPAKSYMIFLPGLSQSNGGGPEVTKHLHCYSLLRLWDEAAAARERTAEIEKVDAWPIMEKKLSEALAAIPDSVPHKIVL